MKVFEMEAPLALLATKGIKKWQIIPEGVLAQSKEPGHLSALHAGETGDPKNSEYPFEMAIYAKPDKWAAVAMMVEHKEIMEEFAALGLTAEDLTYGAILGTVMVVGSAKVQDLSPTIDRKGRHLNDERVLANYSNSSMMRFINAEEFAKPIKMSPVGSYVQELPRATERKFPKANDTEGKDADMEQKGEKGKSDTTI